jgi:hypothetical protein
MFFLLTAETSKCKVVVISNAITFTQNFKKWSTGSKFERGHTTW